MGDEPQVSGVVDEPMWRRIAALGATLDKPVIEASFALFEPLQAARPSSAVMAFDLAYGPHPRHRLDIYSPPGPSDGRRPLLLFVHGGGYASGDKRMGAFFGNLGSWAAEQGVVCAAMNYRLVPDHVWPSVMEDISAAVVWLRAHAAGFGADPDRIILMGHSAGAGHAAGYAVTPAFHGVPGGGLAGLILLSGVYDLILAGDFGRGSRGLYYGASEALDRERSSLAGLGRLDIPLAVIVAERDPPELHQQALAVLQAVQARGGRLPAMARLHSHNHYSEILAVGLDVSAELHSAISAFITFDCASQTSQETGNRLP